MNILTYRDTLSSVELPYECTNTLKILGRAEQCRAKVEKARLINRKPTSVRRNVVKTLARKKRWEEKLLFSKTRLKNCVNILTCGQLCHMNALMDLSRKRMVKRSEDG